MFACSNVIQLHLVCDIQEVQDLRVLKDLVARLVSLAHLDSQVFQELLVTLAVQDHKDSEVIMVSRALWVFRDKLELQDLVEVLVQLGRLETLETEELQVDRDSLVMLDHKDHKVPGVHLVHEESLVDPVSPALLVHRVHVVK